MQLFRDLASAGRAHAGCVATIGAFDGIHRGHLLLIERVLQVAQERALASSLVSFEPLPKEFFSPEDPPARLTRFRERWALLQATGLQQFCVLRFNARLRQTTADAFASQLAAAKLRHLIIGHDFRAGKNGEATTEWFQRHGKQFGFDVEVIPPLHEGSVRISSGVIRERLAAGDLQTAAQLLGRPFCMSGRVGHGERLGRELGFPTANLAIGRRRSPIEGIFAVRVRCALPGPLSQGWWPGVASLGTRPTVGGQGHKLEVHLFDFAADLYGQRIEVEFVARLRGEEKFASVQLMVQQMHRDAQMARASFELI